MQEDLNTSQPLQFWEFSPLMSALNATGPPLGDGNSKMTQPQSSKLWQGT